MAPLAAPHDQPVYTQELPGELIADMTLQSDRDVGVMVSPLGVEQINATKRRSTSGFEPRSNLAQFSSRYDHACFAQGLGAIAQMLYRLRTTRVSTLTCSPPRLGGVMLMSRHGQHSPLIFCMDVLRPEAHGCSKFGNYSHIYRTWPR